MVLPASLLLTLFSSCGAGVPGDTLMSITGVESSGNPFVIANVTDGVSYYLASEEEAVAKARLLTKQGKNFSAGLMQVNSKNFPGYSLTPETVFNYCRNIKAGADILKKCYARTSKAADPASRLKASLSCYYSGNFTRGLIAKGSEKKSYVELVASHADDSNNVPSVSILKNDPDLNQIKKNMGAAPKEQFFITDTHASEPVQEYMDNDDVVNDFITDSRKSEGGGSEKDSGKTAAVGSWDIFKDYGGKE
ncbi:lytic transglycosylase domain-containing protein [Klebsiella quasipneumoniae]|uniref:lytic transglycosylase domain-containing protein n=1 Tax=Klebsiella quasipneumoniae TaxID=1463165 RepID=UPI001DE6AD62|nr:lytic transglycosylase domain-containing protein [Klebsiella quasipneumoniae]MBY5246582.1 lytic transglycosylase domain-containing protein [Klebsiella quasipneumoniae]